MLAISTSELEVALFAEAEFLSRLGGSEPLSLTFDEHRELAGDFVVVGDKQ